MQVGLRTRGAGEAKKQNSSRCKFHDLSLLWGLTLLFSGDLFAAKRRKGRPVEGL